MSIERSKFFQIMSQFASGVTVVTTMHNGVPHGLTVSAFASLSADPTLVLVSINTSRYGYEVIRAAGSYAVNILSEDQADLSNHFATPLEDKFASVDYRLGAHGMPLINGALAYVECKVTAAVPGGDHTIFIGEVLDGESYEGRPLLYFERKYRKIADF
jgi:flavin reductase (DIM6/NTAB) family NADH-FMN oxidoreductase RutF